MRFVFLLIFLGCSDSALLFPADSPDAAISEERPDATTADVEVTCRPTRETCNGRDDNCNGAVDDIELAFCYEGLSHTAALGQCRPGIYECRGSTPVCVGQQLPTAERCDAADNDCDGRIDNGITCVPFVVDLAVIVDVSGSNSIHMGRIRTALLAVMDTLTRNPSIDVALYLIDMPAQWPNAGDEPGPNTTCYPLGTTWPLYPCPNPIDGISALRAHYGGAELSYDVLFDSATMLVDWRVGAERYVVLFGDEPAQTEHGLQEHTVAWELVQAFVTFIGVVEYDRDYDDIAMRTRGRLERLRTSADVIAQAILDEVMPP